MSAKLLAMAMETPIKDPRLKLLLIALADSSNDAGITEPRSADWLGKVVGRERTSIFSYIKNAEKLGWLERLAQFERNQQAPNRYKLCYEQWPNSTVDAVQHVERRRSAGTGDAVQHVEPPAVQHVEPPAVQHVEPPAVQHVERLLNNIHELNLNELNSVKKFSTGQPEIAIPPKVAEYNAKKVSEFCPSGDLIEWAETNCPLVALATTTALWREFVLTRMTSKVKSATAHWRQFMRNQQAWREAEEKEKAGLTVGASSPAPPTRLELVPAGAPSLPAPVPTTAPAVEAEPEVDEVEAAISAMPMAEVAALRQQIETEIKAKIGEKYKFWDETLQRTTINANLRRIVREQLAAREAA